jgi:hypothetical protein
MEIFFTSAYGWTLCVLVRSDIRELSLVSVVLLFCHGRCASSCHIRHVVLVLSLIHALAKVE